MLMYIEYLSQLGPAKRHHLLAEMISCGRVSANLTQLELCQLPSVRTGIR
jgi:hypothetical protein